MAVRTGKRLPLEAISEFWRWFADSAERLKNLYSTNQMESLMREINREIDKVEPELAWEMGPGKKKPYLLTISGEGDPRLRELADLIIQLAPADLEGWELYAARPPRPAPRIVRLPESGEVFETVDWKFIPLEHPKSGRLDLVIVDDQLVRSDRETALKAVSLYLDQLLGEDTVETWIGEFRVESAAAQGNRMYKMADLPDYLLSLTRRKKNPLRKPTN
jgi:hypothetical protein